MKIHSAEFIIGAATTGQFPSSCLPEVAFSGKSNVGKSSLMNALLNRKRLVKTSRTPGKTRQLNFFLINQTFRLVDLPGYGFGKVSKAQKEAWGTLVETYLAERPFLRGVVQILDSRHAPTELDHLMVQWLAAHEVPFITVANKIDKLKKSQVSARIAALHGDLSLAEKPLPFSAKTREGRDALAARLEQWLSPPATG